MPLAADPSSPSQAWFTANDPVRVRQIPAAKNAADDSGGQRSPHKLARVTGSAALVLLGRVNWP